MYKKLLRIAGILCALCAIAVIANSNSVIHRALAAPDGLPERYIVKAKSAEDFASLTADLTAKGSKVGVISSNLNLMVVSALGKTTQAELTADARVVNAGRDRIRTLIRPEMKSELWGKAQGDKKIQKIKVAAVPGVKAPDYAPHSINPDPSYNFGGLMWSVYRVGAPQAWDETGGTGIPQVLVGVADTGLDYTHIDLADNIVHVEDFTWLEEPYNICRDFLGLPTDQELADQYGGPADGDWNGHGSWIGGNIAGVVNGTGINGIAPNVRLVALKISQNCGSAFDSEILAAITYAGDYNIDVVNISFGGYSDRSDPEQNFIWQQYNAVVKYARAKGTAIVSSAGNDHVQIGKKGQVISHGSLTTPGAAVVDYYGMYETPAGIPGVVMVSALGNVVNPSSESCPEGTFEVPNATCKPTSDAHRALVSNRQNMLSYYSNYGSRVDVSAPGGARMFNLPVWDRGGTPGFPYTDANGTDVWESFSTTSNWATEIPCFDLSDMPGFTDDCYTSIQGTSMASPHAAAVLAQIVSARPDLRRSPKALIQVLKSSATQVLRNRTRPLSATDTSPADLTGVPCDTGYCHLGGDFIPDKQAFGAGMVNGFNGVK